MSGLRVVLFARWPQPGRAKTRLIPALGAEGAAELHRRLVEQAVVTCRNSGLPFTIAATGAPLEQFSAWLGAIDLCEQIEGDLGARMAAIEMPAIIVGSDIPDLAPAHLRAAAKALRANRAVLGPALDGGYWLIGLPAPMPWLFADMPWSTELVFLETCARLAAHGVEPVLLDTLADLDLPEDLARWPGLA